MSEPKRVPIIAVSEHPFVLSGPLLTVIGLLYPSSVVVESKPGFAFTIEADNTHVDHDLVERLMEALETVKEQRDDRD